MLTETGMGLITTTEFERNFKNHYRPLCLYALQYTEQTDDAEDVVQQVFTEVWEKNQKGVVIENLKAYLYRAVRNRSLSAAAQTPVSVAADTLPEVEDTSEEEAVQAAERHARMWDAIDRLPTERRKIFLLNKRDGLKYKEIAEELRISVKTVENQMGKALKALRETAVRIYLFFFG